MPEITIVETVEEYLKTKAGARHENTARTYRSALKTFLAALKVNGMEPDSPLPHQLPADVVDWLVEVCRAAGLAASTERLKVTIMSDFLNFVEAEEYAQINLAKITRRIRDRVRHVGQRIPVFPRDKVEQLIVFADNLKTHPTENQNERLTNLRDRALIITLADTGLRIHEACNMVRGDIDRETHKAFIIGKGDKQAPIRFSERSIDAIDDYLKARARSDGATGKPLSGLPVFARHDKGAGKKIKGMGTRTGQNILAQHVAERFGDDAKGEITPHTLRHYFVTRILKQTGNLKLASEMARHAHTSTTDRYAHLVTSETDQAYQEIFNP